MFCFLQFGSLTPPPTTTTPTTTTTTTNIYIYIYTSSTNTATTTTLLLPLYDTAAATPPLLRLSTSFSNRSHYAVCQTTAPPTKPLTHLAQLLRQKDSFQEGHACLRADISFLFPFLLQSNTLSAMQCAGPWSLPSSPSLVPLQLLPRRSSMCDAHRTWPSTKLLLWPSAPTRAD